MRAHERETVLVVLDLLYGNLPPFDGVALLARGTELPLVNISMAIGALAGHIAEHQLGVARHARHFFVHASQRIFRLIVIKLGNAADRFPSTEGVAVLARNVQWPMRAPGSLAALLRLRARSTRQRQQD